MFVRSLPLARTSGFTKSTLVKERFTKFYEKLQLERKRGDYLEAQYTDMVGGPYSELSPRKYSAGTYSRTDFDLKKKETMAFV